MLTAPAAAGAATGCTNPELRLLERVGGYPFGDAVTDFGSGNLAVGQSGLLPAYWQGTEGHVVPLSSPGVGTLSVEAGSITAVNKQNLMVGTYWVIDSGTKPFTYRPGDPAAKWLPLPNSEDPSGSANVHVTDINDRGKIVGYDGNAGKSYVWKNGRIIRELPAPPGVVNVEAQAINNKGVIVGNGFVPETEGGDGYRVGIRWPSNGSAPQELSPRFPASLGSASVTDIDERGRIIGRSHVSHQDLTTGHYWDRPYTAGAITVEGPALFDGSGGFSGSSPTSGLVAGSGSFPHQGGLPDLPSPRATVWPSHGPMLTLPPLAEGFAAWANTASDNGSVGGAAESHDGLTYPVIWTCALQQTE